MTNEQLEKLAGEATKLGIPNDRAQQLLTIWANAQAGSSHNKCRNGHS
jgi:hypothetical protein